MSELPGAPSSLTSIAFGTGELLTRQRIINRLETEEKRWFTELGNPVASYMLGELIASIKSDAAAPAATWKLGFPAPLLGYFWAYGVEPTQAAVQQVVDEASECGRQLERSQIISLLERLNTPLETIEAVTNGQHRP